MYERIEEELKKKGKTFSWLAKKTGMTNEAFLMMKKRKTNLNVNNLVKVADALGISPKKLLGE